MKESVSKALNELRKLGYVKKTRGGYVITDEGRQILKEQVGGHDGPEDGDLWTEAERAREED